jgi:hypothetical protein
MSYLAFLFALILPAAMRGLVRPFGGNASFEGIFKLIAITLVVLPVATAAFLFCMGIAVAITLVAVAILDASGLLTTVEDWSLWSWFPKWLWIVFGALSVFCAFAAVQIRQDRAVRKKGAEVAAPSK